MATEEHFIVTKTTENSSEVWEPPYPPLCYELRLVPPVLHASRSLRLEFKNYYVNDISVRAIFEREDKTINFLLINDHYLMPNCHTEQGSHDKINISIELPESSVYLSKIQIFCYQPSQNWCVWRLDDVKLFSITQSHALSTFRSSDANDEDTTDTVKLIRSLTSVLQANISSARINESSDKNSKLTPPITGPYYNIQLLLCNQ